MGKLCCKWVSKNMTTMNDTKWVVEVTKELPEQDGLKLCQKGLYHYFVHPLIAVMFKEKYGCESYSRLYEVIPEGKIVKDGSLCGATKLTLVKELEIPEVTLEQRVAFCILYALEGYQKEEFVNWAEKWLKGEDRSRESADNIKRTIFFNYPNDDCAKAAYYAICSVIYYAKADYEIAVIYSGDAVIIHDKPINLIPIAKKAMEVQ